MAGQHLQDLQRRAGGMEPTEVERARIAWNRGSSSLHSVQARLQEAAPRMLAGFGPDSEIGIKANETFLRAANRVGDRQQQLKEAADALLPVVDAMSAAKGAAADPPAEPGSPPPPPAYGESHEDITALKIHAGQVRQHVQAVNAFAAADEDARLKVKAIKESYTEATTVLAKIHGDPHIPGPGGGQTPAGGGTPQGPATGGGGPGPVPVVSQGTVHGPAGGAPGGVSDPGVPVPTHPGENPEGAVIGGPSNALPVESGAPGSDGSRGGGANGAAIGGLAAAGLLGGAGVANSIRNAVSGRGPTGAKATIGSTGRTGGPGSLTRPGASSAGSPGSQVNRNAARAGSGAGGRGPGARPAAATPGSSAGARGARGARGGASAGTGGRGRRKDDTAADTGRDLFDDGKDWIDDEDAAPGVLD